VPDEVEIDVFLTSDTSEEEPEIGSALDRVVQGRQMLREYLQECEMEDLDRLRFR